MDNLYIGIDLGKASHMACFLSRELLARHKRFRACPTLKIENSQSGFDSLLQIITKYSTVQETTILLEHCGHYGATLIQFLQEHSISIYHMHVSKRHSWDKTDERDAQSLAMLAYNHLEMHVPSDARIVPLVAPSETVRRLRGLVQRRHELTQAIVQRKNQLTAIVDEVFPEFVQIYKDPNSPSALSLREKFPTPITIAAATIDHLCATRPRTFPSRTQLVHLQHLASTTIGTRDPHQLFSKLMEQKQLIAELRLFNEHLDQLESEIERIIAESREGQILQSFGCIGPMQAAILVAGIGSIANFESEAKLRRYLGWAPTRSQTGTSLDSVSLHRGGNALLKQTMYLVTLNAIKKGYWKALYTRLVERKCNYDERKGKYVGKMKVVGRIAGQIIRVMYFLLKKDYDLVQGIAPGTELPPPQLYKEP